MNENQPTASDFNRAPKPATSGMSKAYRSCDVEGCEGIHYARGFCRPHYGRWHRHGDPLAGRPPKPPKRVPSTAEIKAEAIAALAAAREEVGS